MSGNVVGHKRRWPWAILSLLFAAGLVWSFAVASHGGGLDTLQIGLAVGLFLSLLLLVLASLSSRRARRKVRADAATETEADEQQPTEKRATYEEVFGVQVELDAESLPVGPGQEE